MSISNTASCISYDCSSRINLSFVKDHPNADLEKEISYDRFRLLQKIGYQDTGGNRYVHRFIKKIIVKKECEVRIKSVGAFCLESNIILSVGIAMSDNEGKDSSKKIEFKVSSSYPIVHMQRVWTSLQKYPLYKEVPLNRESLSSYEITDKEIEALRNIVRTSTMFHDGFSETELEKIYQMIPQLLRIKKFIESRQKEVSQDVIKVCGRRDKELQFLSRREGLVYGSVTCRKIVENSSLIYISLPKGSSSTLYGGFKKVTFKVIYFSNHKMKVMAKITPYRNEEGKYSISCIPLIKKGIEHVNKLPPHPNVAKYELTYFEKNQEEPFLIPKYYMKVMRSLEEETEDFMDNLTKWDCGTVIIQKFLNLLKHFREGSNGLFYLHAQGLILNDVKLSNILVGSEQVGKINDFDFMLTVEEAAAGEGKNRGTPNYYISNEIKGIHSDIYALGISLDNLLVVREPLLRRIIETYNNSLFVEVLGTLTGLATLSTEMKQLKQEKDGSCKYNNFGVTGDYILGQLDQIISSLESI